MKKAVLFQSERRFDAFHKYLYMNNYSVVVLDFKKLEWITYDYSDVDLIIYFPNFLFSSNSPVALSFVQDNLFSISKKFPNIKMFPDPNGIQYYSDKYRQFLFLKNTNLPIIPTIPLLSYDMLKMSIKTFNFPLIIKNRYGAGGDYVYFVRNKNELFGLYRQSTMDLLNFNFFKETLRAILTREWWWFALKAKNIKYPFLSFPLLVQKFVEHDSDLKTVVGNNKVVEAHWRRSGDMNMWKMNIDGGGIGEWSYVPDEPIKISEKLSELLSTKWLNIDFMVSGDKFLISEFSPAWHHYEYKEKDSFVYKDNYNIKMPLEESLNLEKMIVESFNKDIDN